MHIIELNIKNFRGINSFYHIWDNNTQEKIEHTETLLSFLINKINL